MFKPATFLLVISFGIGNGQLLSGLGGLKNTLDDVTMSRISTNADDVKFLHYTTETNSIAIDDKNQNSLSSAGLRSDLPIVVTIDGFLSNTTAPMTRLLRESFINGGNVNLIVLDWSQLSGANHVPAVVKNPALMAVAYAKVIFNVGPLGRRLGQFLQKLTESEDRSLNDVTIIGGSLGAHIAASAGVYLKGQVGRIVGLDPAGPFLGFQIDGSHKLRKGAAKFVEIYHSNRGQMGDAEEGTGNVNVYINGGGNQPGCAEADKASMGVCSHGYAFRLYNEAFDGQIKACPCRGLRCTSSTFRPRCSNLITVGPDMQASTRGRYYVAHSKVY